MNKIPFSKPYIGQEEIDAVIKVINSGWITSGNITEEVENKIANYVGAKHCILLNSCTAGLHLSIEYLKRFVIKKENFTAYLPSLTFAATATEVIHSGGDIIFGDVLKEDSCLNPITNKNFDIAIPVHLYGNKAYNKYSVPVIEDSAHLIEKDQCKDNKNLVCFSFFATKNLTMGEGGCICTNNDNDNEWLRQARHHGISKDGWKRYQGGKWEYDIEFIGWKYNPSDILSAVLNANFDKLDEINKERKRCVELYNSLLGYNNNGLHLYPIYVHNRNKFMEMMSNVGISCSVHFLPLHLMSGFNLMSGFKDVGFKQDGLINTEYLGLHEVSLPLFPDLSNKEIEYICKKVLESKLLIKN